MEARERLRQYLEQRRDAGESELVLDSLGVDDVMQLLGAAGRGRSRADERSVPDRLTRPVDERDEHRKAEDVAPPSPRGDEPSPRAAEGATSSPGDWREALRAIDHVVERPPRPRSGERSPAQRGDFERAPAPPAPPAPPVPPDVAPRASSADAEDLSGADEESSAERAPEHSGGEASPPIDRTAPNQGAAVSDRDERPAAGDGGRPSLDSLPAGLIVGTSAQELFGGEGTRYRTLDDIAAAVNGCQKCRLYQTAKNGVPGEGNPDADLVCVGEAPGANEDEQGRPFVGQAGQLLNKILAAIDLAREDVFICNVLKHRPPGNRNPLPDEVAACSPYLVRQIELLQPKVIVAFGTFAAQTLLQTKETIGKLRGRVHRYYGVPLIVTYHPAALLRNPSWKRPTWEDVQLARRLLDRARDV